MKVIISTPFYWAFTSKKSIKPPDALISGAFNDPVFVMRNDSEEQRLALERVIAERTRQLRETNQVLVAQKSELEKIIASRDKFFSIVSHDLRGPIANLTQLVTLMKDPENRTDEMVEMISRASAQTLSLLENLLTWSRSQRGLIRFVPAKIILAAVVKECFDLLYPQAREKHVKLMNGIDPGMLAYGDLVMVQTVLRNLLSNSIKYTNEGGEIKVSVQKSTLHFLMVIVEDSGIGMDEQISRELFEVRKAHSTPGTNGEKGSGLGLVLCKDFVEKNGGRIWVESQAGKGSRFFFTIPIYEGQADTSNDPLPSSVKS